MVGSSLHSRTSVSFTPSEPLDMDAWHGHLAFGVLAFNLCPEEVPEKFHPRKGIPVCLAREAIDAACEGGQKVLEYVLTACVCVEALCLASRGDTAARATPLDVLAHTLQT